MWTGMETDQYDEVERNRALKSLPGYRKGPAESPDVGLDGEEEKIMGRTMEGYPDFGHDMLKYWKFEKTCMSLFGSTADV